MSKNTFRIGRNDTGPALDYKIDPLNNLTGANVVFNMADAPQDGNLIINRGQAIVVSPAANGVVRYSWAPENTANSGIYYGEFEITYPSGQIITYPNTTNAKIVITIDPDLG
jgi:hypothetical protein